MNIYKSKLYIEEINKICESITDDEFTILVTGATGLIGSCIIDSLVYANSKLSKKINIYALSRSIEKLQERFDYADATANLNYIEQDVCNLEIKDLEIDYIINAASNADPGTYAIYPVETILTNVIGTKNILEYGKTHPKTKILFTSTMEVYGEFDISKSNKEDDYGLIDFNQIRNGYPESKRVSELLCKSYAEEYNVYSLVTRLGYIYGPTMSKSDNKVVAQFIHNILKNEDIVLKSEGLQRRSYCYVVDAVIGLFTVLFNGKKSEVYNIASDKSIITIRDLAEIAAKICRSEVILDVPNDIEKRGSSKLKEAVLDTKKLRSLSWNDEYDIVSGLKNTVQVLKDFGR